MTLRLHRFDSAPRGYAQITLPTHGALGAVLDAAAAAEGVWTVDLDPRWRALLVLTESPDPLAAVEGLLLLAGEEQVPDASGPWRLETPGAEGEGAASRKTKRGEARHSLEVRVRVTPGATGSGLLIEGAAAELDPPVRHGVLRAARRGPTRGYPLVDACFQLDLSTAGDGSPPLADLHAAAQQATVRAIQAAGSVVLDPDTLRPNGEPPHLPDPETSIAEVALNLARIATYPVDEADAIEKKQLSAFLAYQVSLLYGHSVDERMKRHPATPPPPLHPFLGWVTETLLGGITPGATVASAMVRDLVEEWTQTWR